MYLTHSKIASDQAIRGRVTACAARENITDPPRWTATTIWNLVGTDWVAAWDSAEAGNPGADHGANEAVVTDQMILSAVQTANI